MSDYQMHVISMAASPALGDIRAAGEGDWIYIHPDASQRPDWSRTWDAVGAAFIRGARVVPLTGEG
jgi:hypothetical protein